VYAARVIQEDQSEPRLARDSGTRRLPDSGGERGISRDLTLSSSG
jgi:hypothetical protein